MNAISRRAVTLLAQTVPALVAGLIYLWLGLRAAFWMTINDFLGFVWLASHQTLARAESFVNGFYPLGYPLLLHALWPLSGNHLATAKILAAASAGAALVAIWRLAYLIIDSRIGATLAVLAIAPSRIFVLGSQGESPDMLASAVVLWSLVLLLERGSRPAGFTAGLLVGLAYLLRHHALVLVVPLAVVAWSLARRADGAGPARSVRARTAGLFLIGFLLGAAPQLIVSGIATGHPFYNRQAVNIGIGVSGVDWYDFAGTTAGYTLRSVLTGDTMGLVRRWLYNLDEYLVMLDGLAVALVVPAVLLLSRPPSARRVIALVAVTLIYLAAISLTFYLARAAIVPAAVGRMLLVAGALALLDRARWAPWRAFALALVLAAFAGVLAFDLIRDVRDTHTSQRLKADNDQISLALHQAGMIDPREVLTTAFAFYDSMDPALRPYYTYGGWMALEPGWAREFPRPALTDPPSLREFAASHHIRFLLLSREARRVIPTIAAAADRDELGPSFRLLWRSGDLSLWSIEVARARGASGEARISRRSARPALSETTQSLLQFRVCGVSELRARSFRPRSQLRPSARK